MKIDLKYRKELEPDPCEFVLAFFVGSEKGKRRIFEKPEKQVVCASRLIRRIWKSKPRILRSQQNKKDIIIVEDEEAELCCVACFQIKNILKWRRNWNVKFIHTHREGDNWAATDWFCFSSVWFCYTLRLTPKLHLTEIALNKACFE